MTSTEHSLLVDTAIRAYFERSITRAATIDTSYRRLWEAMYDQIQAGGKRLRSQMTLLAYEAFGGNDTASVVPAAAAQELLHLSLLVHDDIIDRDFVRYGNPNISGRYVKTYAPYLSNTKEVTHYANAAALMGGDLLLAGSYELIAESGLTEKQKSQALSLLSQSIFEVAGGELLDTEAAFASDLPRGHALTIARYKTASYSFIGPLVTGAMLAGASDEQLDALRRYGLSLGIAYQLVDDILGTFGNEAETGKTTSGDLLEGKRTFMAECALERMNKRDRVLFMRGFGNPQATSNDLEVARKLLVDSGALNESKRMIEHYANDARESAARFEIIPSHRESFDRLIEKATKRTL